MPFDPTPWFVGGGARHSPEVARLLAYAATAGAEGIVTPDALKVTAQEVPTDQIIVAPGACTMVNRSPGADQQSYTGRNPINDVVTVPATASAARTDLVIVRVEDPQYAPWTAPPDMTAATFIRTHIITGVSSTIRSAKQLNLGYPAIALARITRPAGTSVVSDAHVTDLRNIAQPRRHREVFHKPSTGAPAAGAVNALTSDTLVNWPAGASWTVETPEWATHAIVRGDIVSYVLKSAFANGRVRPKFGAIYGEESSYDENYTGSPHRNTLAFIHKFPIAADLRGTDHNLSFWGMRSTGTGYIDADTYTVSIADVEFVEEAV